MGKKDSVILCDTNVIIEVLKGRHETIREIERIGLDNLGISAVTVMELYFGALSKRELNKIKNNLQSLQIIHVDSEISEVAVDLVEKYSKNFHFQIPDAIIAATALVYEIELFTYNLKDFKFIKDIRLH